MWRRWMWEMTRRKKKRFDLSVEGSSSRFWHLELSRRDGVSVCLCHSTLCLCVSVCLCLHVSVSVSRVSVLCALCVSVSV